MTRFRDYWMIRIFSGKSGSVRKIVLFFSNFLPKILEIPSREIWKLKRDTRAGISKLTTFLPLQLNWSWEQLSLARVISAERSMLLTRGFRGKLDNTLNFQFQ